MKTKELPLRTRMLRKVFFMSKLLGISNEDLHVYIEQFFGKKSFKECNENHLGFLLDALHYMMYGTRKNIERMSKELRKLAKAKGISDERLNEICVKIVGRERPEWCEDIKEIRRIFAIVRKMKEVHNENKGNN
jgi:hypothetical protein